MLTADKRKASGLELWDGSGLKNLAGAVFGVML